MTVYTDHSAIKSILETQCPTGKHARWWTKVYGSGVKQVQIVHRSGRTNTNANALSRNPLPKSPDTIEILSEGEIQVAVVQSEAIFTVFTELPTEESKGTSFATKQKKDAHLLQMMQFLETGELSKDTNLAKKITGQSSYTQFTLVDQTL